MKSYYPSYYPSYVTSPSHKILVKVILALNLDAKVGPLTLSDSRQHKKCVF